MMRAPVLFTPVLASLIKSIWRLELTDQPSSSLIEHHVNTTRRNNINMLY
jgi:hypothetical protein